MSYVVKSSNQNHTLVEKSDSGWITLWGNSSSYIKYRKANNMVNIVGYGEKTLASGSNFEVTLPEGYRPDFNLIVSGTARAVGGMVQAEVHQSGELTIFNISSSSISYFAFTMMYFVGGGNQ